MPRPCTRRRDPHRLRLRSAARGEGEGEDHRSSDHRDAGEQRPHRRYRTTQTPRSASAARRSFLALVPSPGPPFRCGPTGGVLTAPMEIRIGQGTSPGDIVILLDALPDASRVRLPTRRTRLSRPALHGRDGPALPQHVGPVPRDFGVSPERTFHVLRAAHVEIAQPSDHMPLSGAFHGPAPGRPRFTDQSAFGVAAGFLSAEAVSHRDP